MRGEVSCLLGSGVWCSKIKDKCRTTVAGFAARGTKTFCDVYCSHMYMVFLGTPGLNNQ